MGSFAKSNQLSVKAVWAIWAEEKNKLAILGGGERDKSSNILMSIQLSVNCQRMKNNPNALILLSILAILPGGATAMFLKDCSPRVDGFWVALNSLLNVALVQLHPVTRILSTLPLVQIYVQEYHPVSKVDLKHLQEVCFRMISEKATQGKAGRDVLLLHESNIQNVLMVILKQDVITPDVMQTAYKFAQFQYDVHYHSAIVGKLLEVAEQGYNDEYILKSKQLLASTHMLRGHLSKANSMYREIMVQAADLGDQAQVARSMQNIGDINRVKEQYTEARVMLEEAKQRYEKLGDRYGVAQCLRSIGEVLRGQAQYKSAISAFLEAKDHYQAIRSTSGIAQCLKGLGDVHRMQRQFDDATSLLTQAKEQFQLMGQQLPIAQCLQSLGNVARGQYHWTEAKAYLTQAIERYQEISHKAGMAQCMRSLGEIYRYQHKFSDAKAE